MDRHKPLPDLFSGMIANNELRQQYIQSGWLVSIPISVVSSHWLHAGEQRLDGGYYSQEAVAAQRIIDDSGFKKIELKNLVSDVFILGRFKRVYATDQSSGWEYLSASEALSFRPSSNEWLARDHAPSDAARHFAKSEWILISSSGSVGRLILATKRLEKFFLTHDLIRIIPPNDYPIGYLYAFLSTWIGQAVMVKDKYGAAIKHLEPHHVANISVPILPQKEQKNIHDKITHAYNLRDDANELLDRALDLFHHKLELPIFDESLVPYLPTPQQKSEPRYQIPHPKAFSIKYSEISERFDGSYHVPTARTAIKLLQHGKYPVQQLQSLVDDIVVSPRFKRIYVPKEYGIPLLQGSHLPQMRPNDLKYISRTQQKKLGTWIIKQNWVLVTCSGTIGRVGLVTSHRDGWAASQHLLRIIPDNTRSHPGYIAAFLLTPYGQYQLLSKTYGGVVDEITSEDTGQIWIPNAPLDVQEEIGDLVMKAFIKKDEASYIEETTIQELESRLSGSAA